MRDLALECAVAALDPMKIDYQTSKLAAICWFFVGAVAVGVAIALAILGPRMRPIRPGSVKDFWKLAAGVDLDGIPNSISGYVYFPDDGKAAYSRSHLHGSDLFFVPQEEVIQHFGTVTTLLQEAADRNEDTPFVRGFKNWKALDSEYQTIHRLLHLLKMAQWEAWATTNVYAIAGSVEDENYFWQRWQRLKWYWANYVFEWAFLSGLALFVVWPGIRGPSIYRWAAHLGITPLLFMLPTFLGYATFSFTSAGLSGGIVYPYLLQLTFGGRCTATDRWLLAHLPKILEPLSAPIGSWVSLSGRGMPGPTSIINRGLLIAIGVILTSFCWRLWRRRASSKAAVALYPRR